MIAIPSDPPREMIDRVGGGDYRNLLAFAPDFRGLGINPGRVLEIGCGCGRGALLVSEVWPEAEYVGLDVDAAAVAWCQANVSGAEFHALAMRNGMYAAGNRGDPAAPWPIADGSVDFVFSISVFTHMLPSDVAHYLRETARVLVPGGMALHTWFLVDGLRKPGIGFTAMSNGFYAANPENPEAIAGYSPAWMADACADAGLFIVTLRTAHWAGYDGVPPMSMDESRVRANEYQDYTVLVK